MTQQRELCAPWVRYRAQSKISKGGCRKYSRVCQTRGNSPGFSGPQGQVGHATTQPCMHQPSASQATAGYGELHSIGHSTLPVVSSVLRPRKQCSRHTHPCSEVWRLSTSPPAVPGTEHAVKCGASVPVLHCLQCFGPALPALAHQSQARLGPPLHVQPHFSAWPCQWQLTRTDTPRGARTGIPSGLCPGACMCS